MYKIICPNCNKEYPLAEETKYYTIDCDCGQKMRNQPENNSIIRDNSKYISTLVILILILSFFFRDRGGMIVIYIFIILFSCAQLFFALIFKGYWGRRKYYTRDDNPIQFYVGIISMVGILLMLLYIYSIGGLKY